MTALTATMDNWSTIACVFYVLQVAHAGTPHTSKACYGAAGLPCTEHNINCNNTQKIDIKDAYYTNNTDCTKYGLNHCLDVTLDNVTESGKRSFNTTEMSSLRRHCSTSCTYRATRRNPYLAFSVVRYECSGEVRFTIGPTEDISPVSGTTHTSKACYGAAGLPCTEHNISCNKTQKIDIKDAYYTNNTDCTPLGLTNCEKVTPDNVTESGKHSFNITELSSLNRNCSTSCTYRAPRRNASLAFSVVRYECSEEVRFTTGPTEDTSLVSSSSRFQAGLFVGGVAVGVVMVILVGLAVYLLIVRPRYNLTPKKQGDTPASVEHPTYSGMSAGGDVNNYDIIEQTSVFQGDTAHELVSTPEYKNI